MNTLKMFLSVTLILIVSIVTGCSNSGDPVSPSGFSSNENINSGSYSVSEGLPIILPVVPTFKAVIRLKPSRSYTFNFSNTGFVKINTVDINSVHAPSSTTTAVFKCSELLIYGDNKNDVEITCHSRELDVSWLTIENLSSRMLDLDVSLLGVKVK